MIYNLNQIVSIESIDEHIIDSIEYREYRKRFLNINIFPEGFYNIKTNKLIEWEPFMFKKGDFIWSKCSIIINFSNGDTYQKYFDNIKDRDLFLKREFSSHNWLNWD